MPLLLLISGKKTSQGTVTPPSTSGPLFPVVAPADGSPQLFPVGGTGKPL